MQPLLTGIMRNIWRTVRRICMLMREFKGLTWRRFKFEILMAGTILCNLIQPQVHPLYKIYEYAMPVIF